MAFLDETGVARLWAKIKAYVAANAGTDTKNTAGSTDSSSKLFLIGAKSQAANPQTYSHDTAYVGTDGCLYSGGSKVLTAHPTITKSSDSTSTASPSAGGTFTAVDSVTRDANGHVTKVNTKTVTLPNTSIAVDNELSPTSTNPVQNKVVSAELNNINENLTSHSHHPYEAYVAGDITDYVDNATGGYGFFELGGGYEVVGTLHTVYTYTSGYYTKRANNTSTIVVHRRDGNGFIKKTRYNGGTWSDWEEFATSTWKATTSYPTAYAGATSEIIVELSGLNGTTRVSYTIAIPKIAIINGMVKYFVNGYYYNSSSYSLAQIALSATSCTNVVLTVGNTTNICDSVIFYYR